MATVIYDTDLSLNDTTLHESKGDLGNFFKFLSEFSKLQTTQPINLASLKNRPISISDLARKHPGFKVDGIRFNASGFVDSSVPFLTVSGRLNNRVPVLPKDVAKFVIGDLRDLKSQIRFCTLLETANYTDDGRVLDTESYRVFLEKFNDYLAKRNQWIALNQEQKEVTALYNSLIHLFDEYTLNQDEMEIVLGTFVLYSANDTLSENDEMDSDEEQFNNKKKSKSIRYPLIIRTLRLEPSQVAPELFIYVNDDPYVYDYPLFVLSKNRDRKYSMNQQIRDMLLNVSPFDPTFTEGSDDFVEIEDAISHIDANAFFVNQDEFYIPEDCPFYVRDEAFIMLRPKVSGVQKVLEEEVDYLAGEHADVSPFVRDVLTGNFQSIPDKSMTREEKLLALGGEYSGFYFTKAINKEQLKIVQALDKYNAVLVQGPPGTGKTHTIANLIGHILAEGKTVLVTSYKNEALRVLREQLDPEIAKICISYLDSGKKSGVVDETVRGVSEVDLLDYDTLKKKIDYLESVKNTLVISIQKCRNDLMSLLNKGWKNININGKSYSVTELAREVSCGNKNLDLIPSLNDEYVRGLNFSYPVFPFTEDEIKTLYNSNAEVTVDIDSIYTCGIISVNELITPDDFLMYIEEFNNFKNISSRMTREYQCGYDSRLKQIVFNQTSLGRQIFLLTEWDESYQKYEECIDNLLEYRNECESMLFLTFNESENIWSYLESFIDKANLYYQNISLDFSDIEKLDKTFSKETIIKEIGYLKNNNVFGVQAKPKVFEFSRKKFYEEANRLGIYPKCKDDLVKFENYYELLTLRKQINSRLIALGILPKDGNYVNHYSDHPEAHLLHDLKWKLRVGKSAYLLKEELIPFLVSEVKVNVVSLMHDSKISNWDSNRLLNLLEDYVRPYFIFLKAINSFSAAYNKVNESYKKINSHSNQSDFYKKMVKSIIDNDVDTYSECYSILSKAPQKSALLEKRYSLLDKVNQMSSAWYESLVSREGRNGDSSVNYYDLLSAWEYLIKDNYLKTINNQEIDNLYHKSDNLSKEYKRAIRNLTVLRAQLSLKNRLETKPIAIGSLRKWQSAVKSLGKGTGKNAEKKRAQIRSFMRDVESVIPAWIIPYDRAMKSLTVGKSKFDVIIVDEASQCDISTFSLSLFAKKMIVVGDDEQVSPSNVGLDEKILGKMQKQFLDPTGVKLSIDRNTSLYDLFKWTYQNISLREHFRCVPDIIEFSNKLSYGGDILPLRPRDDSQLKPIIRIDVDGHKDKDINIKEAEMIVALIKACLNHEEYSGKTFGIISMISGKSNRNQMSFINSLLQANIERKEVENHRIKVGTAATFQGDERDVVFISLVDTSDNHVSVDLVTRGGEVKKRFNVAVSRARDQLWIVNSFGDNTFVNAEDPNHLLLEYADTYAEREIEKEVVRTQSESIFEKEVGEFLVEKGYKIQQQYQVSNFRIDIVAFSNGKQIAIECDGERYHSTEEQTYNDIQRQNILERIGWDFIRIRGYDYFRDKVGTLNRLLEQLNEYGIYPINSKKQDSECDHLVLTIKNEANEILKTLKSEGVIDQSLQIDLFTENKITASNVRKSYNHSSFSKFQNSVASQRKSQVVNHTGTLNVNNDKHQSGNNGVNKTDGVKNTGDEINDRIGRLTNLLTRLDLKVVFVEPFPFLRRIYAIYDPNLDANVLRQKRTQIDNLCQIYKFNLSDEPRGVEKTNNQPCWRIEIRIPSKNRK